ncbi:MULTISPECIES: LuxR C-terminal-related transcriptional regulator [Clostridia]|uniref:LuxR C-terminal-related transcriptional regulator n=1 Tax=Clostridia TaxID=186801 RepID=UPI000EA07466|nr:MULTISPECIES: LuxR C-terminal-related transcriptional regulator [Clostridia]NBJ70624.1 DNA-binding response regulator [Roseburia sp. 1XD42-34]RKI76623.1 DNA-binding response regulator [Clostridium sp. 1xD42-85]
MNKEQIERAIKDYNWMIREIKRQRQMLKEDIGTKVVSASGVAATLPKSKGVISDPVAKEVIRRDQKSNWLTKLEKKVLFIQERLPTIDEPREVVVLECMLDGMTISAISKHMGLSRKHIYTIKETIVQKMLQFTQSSQ